MLVALLVVVSALFVACGHGGSSGARASALETVSIHAAPGDGAAANGKRPWARPFLWRIEKTPPSYLFGTIHLPDERLEPLLPSIERALAASDVVLTELPMDETTRKEITTRMVLPREKTLKTELPADVFVRAQAALRARGLPLAPFARMKVWAFSIQLLLLDRAATAKAGTPLDARLYAEARGAGKVVGGIETVDEQMGVFDNFSRAEQARLLRQTLDTIDAGRKDDSDLFEKLLALYLTGDDAATRDGLAQGFDPTNPIDAKTTKNMLTDRNKIMADRMWANVQATPARGYFFAVGVAHLVGDDGLVATLTKRGLKLTRLEAE